MQAPYFNEFTAHMYVESCRNAALSPLASAAAAAAAGVQASSSIPAAAATLSIAPCPSCWLSEVEGTGDHSSSEELNYSSSSRGSGSDTSEEVEMECEEMLEKPVRRERTRLESCYLRTQHVDLLVDEVDMQEAEMERKSNTRASNGSDNNNNNNSKSEKHEGSDAGHLSSSSSSGKNSGNTAERMMMMPDPHFSITENADSTKKEERRREHFQWWFETKDTPGTRNMRCVGKGKQSSQGTRSSNCSSSDCSCRSKSPPTAAPLGGTSAVAARTTPIPSSTRSNSPLSSSSPSSVSAAAALSKFTSQVTRKKEKSAYPLQSREYMENVLLGQRRQQELALKMLLAESMRNAWEAELQRVQLYMYYLYDECEEEMRYFDYQYFVFQFKCDWDQLFLDVDEYLKQPNSMVSYCATILHAMELFQRFHKVQQDVARAKDRVRQRYEALQQYQLQLQMQQEQYDQQGEYHQQQQQLEGEASTYSNPMEAESFVEAAIPSQIEGSAADSTPKLCTFFPSNEELPSSNTGNANQVSDTGSYPYYASLPQTHTHSEVSNIFNDTENRHLGENREDGGDDLDEDSSTDGKTLMASASLYDWSVATNASSEAYHVDYSSTIARESAATGRGVADHTITSTSTTATATGNTAATTTSTNGAELNEREVMAYYYSSSASAMQHAIAEENTMMMMECNDSFGSSVNSNIPSPFHCHPAATTTTTSSVTPMNAGVEVRNGEHSYAYETQDTPSSSSSPSGEEAVVVSAAAAAPPSTSASAAAAADLTIDCDPSPVYVPLSWFRAQDTDVRVEVYSTRRDRKIRCMQRRNMMLERRSRRRNQNQKAASAAAAATAKPTSTSEAAKMISVPTTNTNSSAEDATVADASAIVVVVSEGSAKTSTKVTSKKVEEEEFQNEMVEEEEENVDFILYNTAASLGCLQSLAPAGPCEDTTLLTSRSVTESKKGKDCKEKESKPAGALKVSTITHITIPRNQSFQASRSRGDGNSTSSSSSSDEDDKKAAYMEGMEEDDGKRDAASSRMQSSSTRSRRLATSGRTSNISGSSSRKSSSSVDRKLKRPMPNIVQVGCFGLTFFSRYE